MSDRSPVTNDDLRAAASMVAGSVLRLDPELWDRLAYGLEWTRSRTVAHIGGALSNYAGSLASRNQENPGSLGLAFREGSTKAAATQIGLGAELLVRVAEGAPAGVRAFHPTGLPDAEGFLAMGCVEILAHGYDAVAGTEAEFDTDNALCQRVLGRLFPWAPLDTPGWPTLLWATGRSQLEGQEYLGETWIWHNDLLDEWEGTIPNTSRWVGR
jgi:hypothetical protein